MNAALQPDAPLALPDPRVCEQARLSRDARFDGRFFTAVTSTGIYCRPVCPAPAPKAANVVYFANAAAAEAAAWRPWRAYAVIQLWRENTLLQRDRKRSPA